MEAGKLKRLKQYNTTGYSFFSVHTILPQAALLKICLKRNISVINRKELIQTNKTSS
jgi:hypothetical protein